MSRPVRVVAFASGGGTNLQALLDRVPVNGSWTIVGLVANKPDAGALDRARQRGIETVVIPTKDRPEPDVAGETLEWLEARETDLICLAGYMRLVPAAVVDRYRRRILNVHPALLPAFGGQGMYGRRVHQAVIDSGARVSGVTVHWVDERYDEGTIVAQWPVPVLSGDTPEALAARVLEREHTLYPRVVDHVCSVLARGEEPGPMPWSGELFEVS